MKNLFFEQFLMISDLKTIFMLILLTFILYGINKLPKKKFTFSARVTIATVAGLFLGFLIQFISKFPKNPMDSTEIVKLLRELIRWLYVRQNTK